ncbi:DUF732 domain-containing protein [Mycolicibacterium pyrenivorans]|uniref:DUF732 domain-containing protein n=1 Tax=Mycolicibacterium pyrenivorans TaxID=187102 RepID=UPI000B118418|nr:DUF732 domain-containing protein [Mycolicibacterium pyrenivorans]MCV7149822.1 DUF732 domain-containing protein [Mycolicibacterium pyrenivorans]
MKRVILAVAFAGLALTAPAVAHADPDTDFANALHTVGIYGQKDYNAWIAKIACERIDRGVDKNAYDSAEFVSNQLPKGSTTEQAWKFLGLAYPTYCPAHQALLQLAAEKPA